MRGPADIAPRGCAWRSKACQQRRPESRDQFFGAKECAQEFRLAGQDKAERGSVGFRQSDLDASDQNPLGAV